MTTLQTFTAIIKDKAKIVNQLFNPKTGEITYTVNGRFVDSNKFWSLRPVIVKK